MTDRQDYETLMSEYVKILADRLFRPMMPMPIYLQEAEDLNEWSVADRILLERAGLDPSVLDGLRQRISGARHAQSLWTVFRFSKAEAQKIYDKESPAAYALRDNILHHMKFAYRKIPSTKGRVRKISQGRGDADMVQDLSDTVVLGRQNRAPLEAIQFDFSLLDQADEKVAQITPLLARATGSTAESKKAKLIRDQAYSYLKEAVDEIRDYGQYVFWKNEARQNGYYSAYRREANRQSPTDATDDTSDESTNTESIEA